MTARHAPPPRHRIAAASVWADNLPQRCKWFTFAAAVALVGGGLAVPFVGGLNTQVQAATAEHLALTPERSAEPSAHGGPLAPLSIGVVAPETDVPVVPPIVRVVRQASSHPVQTRAVPSASVASPTETPAAPSATPDETTPTTTRVESATPVTTPAETTTTAPTTTDEPTVTDPSSTTATTTTALTITIWRHHHHG